MTLLGVPTVSSKTGSSSSSSTIMNATTTTTTTDGGFQLGVAAVPGGASHMDLSLGNYFVGLCIVFVCVCVRDCRMIVILGVLLYILCLLLSL